jgi:hypothetical protein
MYSGKQIPHWTLLKDYQLGKVKSCQGTLKILQIVDKIINTKMLALNKICDTNCFRNEGKGKHV